MKRILPCLLLLAAAAARADLVAQFTFARDDLLEAKVGAKGREVASPSKGTVSYTDTATQITAVTDSSVLGDRTGVIAIPVSIGFSVPNPGLDKDWTLVQHFYAPDNASWRCFFTVRQDNDSDGTLFIKNNDQIGVGGQYTTIASGSLVGAWHQLVVSCNNGTASVWCDTQKMNQTRSWAWGGLTYIHMSLDESGEDALMYFDEIRLYDESKPSDLFPDGADSPVVIETDRDEPDGTAPAVFFF